MISVSRSLLAAVLLGTACLTGCGPVGWERSFEAGLSKAANERRPALVMFSSAVSPDCMRMDREVFEDPEVQNVLRSFVPVRVDFLLNSKLAKELNVQSVPTFVIFRPDRSVAAVREGKMDARSFTIFLIKYRYY